MTDLEALNREVAEKVMGWVRRPAPLGVLGDWFWIDQDAKSHGRAEFATDIAAAFEVVEKLRSKGYGFVLTDIHPQSQDWRADFVGSQDEGCVASSIPEAICRAALQVVKTTEKINAT